MVIRRWSYLAHSTFDIVDDTHQDDFTELPITNFAHTASPSVRLASGFGQPAELVPFQASTDECNREHAIDFTQQFRLGPPLVA